MNLFRKKHITLRSCLLALCFDPTTLIEIAVYTLLISCGAILNIKFMTSFAESNLSSQADFWLRWIHVFSSGALGILWLVTFLFSCCRINPQTNYTKERQNCDHLSLIKGCLRSQSGNIYKVLRKILTFCGYFCLVEVARRLSCA